MRTHCEMMEEVDRKETHVRGQMVQAMAISKSSAYFYACIHMYACRSNRSLMDVKSEKLQPFSLSTNVLTFDKHGEMTKARLILVLDPITNFPSSALVGLG
eukprot:m.226865 g.226865  ORF g.226865 m.226865 type:complete len:101 (-) comp15171_c0_seq18:899-1201(-)